MIINNSHNPTKVSNYYCLGSVPKVNNQIESNDRTQLLHSIAINTSPPIPLYRQYAIRYPLVSVVCLKSVKVTAVSLLQHLKEKVSAIMDEYDDNDMRASMLNEDAQRDRRLIMKKMQQRQRSIRQSQKDAAKAERRNSIQSGDGSNSIDDDNDSVNEELLYEIQAAHEAHAGKSALVLFYDMNSCVQYKVSLNIICTNICYNLLSFVIINCDNARIFQKMKS